MEDGPFKQYLEQSTEGVIRQELITYRIEEGVLKIKNGTLVKETHMRSHTFYGDYHDSYMSEPLIDMKEVPKETMH